MRGRDVGAVMQGGDAGTVTQGKGAIDGQRESLTFP
jgi:hypothetical protein